MSIINTLPNVNGFVAKPLVNSLISTKNGYSQAGLNNIYIIDFKTPVDINKYIDILKCNSDIEYAEPYYTFELHELPNDPLTVNQYYLNNINAYKAYNIARGDTNVVIAIVDTGVDLNHDDLFGNIKFNYNDPINGIDDDMDGYVDNFYGWDFADYDNNPHATVSIHGTRVAGLAAAVTNNNIGIYGISNNCRFMPIKIANDNGTIIGAYEGVLYAADHGCKIINCSWGSNFESLMGKDIIDYAINYRNCIVVASAGNSKTDLKFYPASYNGVISVGATNIYDNKWSGSSYGTLVDICAPGENVYSTSLNNSYSYGNGTSYSAPIVAGAAALLVANLNITNPTQVAEKLRITADIIDTLPENLFFKYHMGYGRLNIFNALTDTTLPSVRITSYNVFNHKGQIPMAGDSLFVACNFTNYLSQTSNTLIRVSSDNDHIEITNNTFSAGKLLSMQQTNNYSNPFIIKVKNDAPKNLSIKLFCSIKDQGYNDYQFIDFFVNPDYINFDNGTIKTSVCGNGKIGFSDTENKYGLGIIYQKQNILADGGIIIGYSPQNMASAVVGNYTFKNTSAIDTQFVDNKYYFSNTQFEPADTIDFKKIIVTNKIVLQKNTINPSTIFYYYTIKNIDNIEIRNLRMGLYADFDLIYQTSNETGYIDSLNLLYTFSNLSKLMYSGICLLNNIKSVPHSFDIIAGGNGGLDITNSFTREQKWYAMQTQRIYAGNNGDSINVSTLLSTPEFALMPNDTIQFCFAIIAANNYFELTNAAQLAIYEYRNSLPQAINKTKLNFNVWPNPATKNININTCFYGNKVINIIDLTGKVIFTGNYTGSFINIKTSQLPKGVFIIEVIENKTNYRKKIIIE